MFVFLVFLENNPTPFYNLQLIIDNITTQLQEASYNQWPLMAEKQGLNRRDSTIAQVHTPPHQANCRFFLSVDKPVNNMWMVVYNSILFVTSLNSILKQHLLTR